MGLAYSLRTLRRNPALVVTVLVTLGLGVGANTAVFRLLVELQWWEPEHVTDPNRVVSVGPSRNYTEYRTLRDEARTLDVAAYSRTSHRIAGGTDLAEVRVECVTGSYFSVLGVRPLLGRSFPDDAGDTNGERLALLSEGFWTRNFGGEASAVGSPLRFSGEVFRIVGVMPARFRGVESAPVDVWIPLASAPALCSFTGTDLTASADGSWLRTIGRLRDGASRDGASAEVAALLGLVAAESGAGPSGPQEHVMPLGRSSRDTVRQLAVARRLAAGAGAIFLIACTNVALLLAIHVAGRRREIALRLQLGASRWRIAALALTDSALLACAGGVLALLVAHWIHLVLRNAVPSVDTTVIGNVWLLGLLGTFVACAALLSGLLPALHALRVDAARLAGGGRVGVMERRGHGFRMVLAAQLALGLALTSVTGLVVQSLVNLTADIGYRVDGVVVGTFDLTGEASGPGSAALVPVQNELIGRLERLPDVESASLAFGPILDSGGFSRMAMVRAGEGERTEMSLLNVVTPHYFATLGTRIISGRAFGPYDTAAGDPVVILDEGTAGRLWGGEEPHGRCIVMFQVPCVTVIGVSEARRQASLTGSVPEVFVPFSQVALYDAGILPQTLFVRLRDERPGALGAVAAAARSVSAQLPLKSIRPLHDLVDDQTRSRQLAATLFGLFSMMAVALACVGAYAVVSAAVRERTREIGIRVAVGAAPRQVVRLVFGEGVVPLAVGWALGAVASVAAARMLGSLLFNVSATDPFTMSLASLMLGLAVLSGCLGPALRALRVDPAITLREP